MSADDPRPARDRYAGIFAMLDEAMADPSDYDERAGAMLDDVLRENPIDLGDPERRLSAIRDRLFGGASSTSWTTTGAQTTPPTVEELTRLTGPRLPTPPLFARPMEADPKRWLLMVNGGVMMPERVSQGIPTPFTAEESE